MKATSLRHKLLLAISSAVLLYAGLSILFVNVYFSGILKRNMISGGTALVSTISAHIADSVLIRDFLGIDHFFHTVKEANSEVAYLFVEKEGAVLVHTFHEGFPRGLLGVGHRRGQPDYVVIEGAGKEIYYDFSSPILNGRAGTLRLGVSGAMVGRTIANAVTSLLTVAVGALALALLLSVVISNRLVVRPLSVLTATATDIARGDYARVVPVETEDEIGRLADAFNKMLEAVRLREGGLREINEELEEVNVKLHEYIGELDRTRDELIKAKQDRAVVETKGALLHHVRQPLTSLIMSIELLIDEMKRGGVSDSGECLRRVKTIEEAGERVAEILRKFEELKEYKAVEYAGKTTIVDIEVQ